MGYFVYYLQVICYSSPPCSVGHLLIVLFLLHFSTDTVRKGIIDINSFNGTEELAMIGSLSALSGTGIWLIVATFFNLPVSGTHSIVGATMGYALVAHGLDGIKWKTLCLIGEM